MADLSHIITLGIGTPGDIEHFILFGLNGATPIDTTVHGSGMGYVAMVERPVAHTPYIASVQQPEVSYIPGVALVPREVS